MYIGHARLSVSVRGGMSTLLHGPGCNLGSDSGCPLIVQLGGFVIGARVSLLWQHSANAKCQWVLVGLLALCLVILLLGILKQTGASFWAPAKRTSSCPRIANSYRQCSPKWYCRQRVATLWTSQKFREKLSSENHENQNRGPTVNSTSPIVLHFRILLFGPSFSVLHFPFFDPAFPSRSFDTSNSYPALSHPKPFPVSVALVVFISRISSLSPNQQYQSTKGKPSKETFYKH